MSTIDDDSDLIIEKDYEGRINLEYYQQRYEIKITRAFRLLIEIIIKDMFKDANSDWEKMKGFLKENTTRFITNGELIYNVIGESKNKVRYDVLKMITSMMTKNYISMNSTINPIEFDDITPEKLFGKVFEHVTRELYHNIYLFMADNDTEKFKSKNKSKLRNFIKKETIIGIKLAFPLIIPKHEDEEDLDVIINNNKKMLINHEKLKHILDNDDVEEFEKVVEEKEKEKEKLEIQDEINKEKPEEQPKEINNNNYIDNEEKQVQLAPNTPQYQQPIQYQQQQNLGYYNPNIRVPQYIQEQTHKRNRLQKIKDTFFGRKD